ncbi:hypothetical protein BDV06DRAFT_211707 [Aspergillus oleicola]
MVEQFMLNNIDPIVLPGQYTRVITLYLVNETAPPKKTHTPITPMRFSAYYELLNEASQKIYREHLRYIPRRPNRRQRHLLNAPSITSSLFFPDCTNPDTFETAYSKTPDWFDGYEENRCPAAMYRIPRLRFSIRYYLREILPEGHGDFINGWLVEAAEDMLNDPSKSEYFEVKGWLGSGDQGSACEREARDSDSGYGTDDYVESLKMMEKKTDTDVMANQTLC